MEAASLHQLLVDLERPLSAELAAAKEAERFFDCELRRRREALSEWTERNSLKMRRPLTDYFTVSLCTAGSVLVFVISVAISVLGHRSSVHFWAWVDLFFDSSFFAFGAVPLGIVLCAFACSVCAARPREFREGSFGVGGGEGVGGGGGGRAGDREELLLPFTTLHEAKKCHAEASSRASFIVAVFASGATAALLIASAAQQADMPAEVYVLHEGGNATRSINLRDSAVLDVSLCSAYNLLVTSISLLGAFGLFMNTGGDPRGQMLGGPSIEHLAVRAKVHALTNLSNAAAFAREVMKPREATSAEEMHRAL